MADTRRVVLIDLSSLFWTAWHSSGSDAVSAARERTLAAVNRCAGVDELVAICCDSGRSFRKDILPAYKANRPEKDHAALGELDAIKARLRADGYLLWQADGLEADDVIATATIEAEVSGHDVQICTSDKDLLQLVGDHVRCLRTHNWTDVGPDEVIAKFGVTPFVLGDWLALVGDSSDNIKGCPGVGPVKATELIKKYGGLPAMWLDLDRGAAVSTPAVTKALKENRAAVELARKLVTLRTDAPIKFAEIYEERRAIPISGKAEEEDMDEPEPEFTDIPATSSAPPEDPPAAPSSMPSGATAAPPAVTVQPTTAIVQRSYETELEPTSIGTAFRLAKGLYDSRLYSRFPNPEAIMAVIIRGREMGLGALTSLDSFHVIEGKPAPHAYLIIARAKAAPECEFFQCVESTPERATWETKNRRNPRPTRVTYTLVQAQAAGLVKPGGNWTKRPDEMLRKTAGVQLARMEYPEAAMGLYAVEEMAEAA